MDRATIERIDAFAYRLRVLEVMTTPVVTIAPEATLETATRLMREKRISAVIALDEQGAPEGILTERDVLAAVARDGAAALARPVAGLMSRPVIAVPPDAFLHAATRTINEYNEFLQHRLSQIPGVQAIDSRIVLEETKNTTELPLDASRAD